ncbi:MAG TPA: hypothetical protein VFN44_08285 [Solirubrobacteraceae bacterium]|nr:hypothetical protein [Solirubrobacteraceae bacterium]
MPPAIVYIHGNGNKVRSDLLKRQWDQALFGRDAGEQTRMAYWAPLLHPEPLPDPQFDEIEHEAPVEESAAAEEAAVPAELEAYMRAMTVTAEALVEGEEAAPAADGEVLPEALPLPRAARIRVFEQLVRLTFKDVHAYFFRGFAERMRDVLRTTLQGIDEPFVLVSHSLGTIIAYDVLREAAARDLDVQLLVTVGSPLGVREIQDLVTSPLQVPDGVRAWLNASDLRDVVALDHTLRDDYRPAEAITDLIVPNASANHHGIREYLSAAAVRDAILAVAAPPEPVQPEAAGIDEEQLNREHGRLLESLRPVLSYDSRERYFAGSVEGFVENRFEDGPMRSYATRLLRGDGRVIAAADGELAAGFLGRRRYADDQPVDEDDRLDAGPEPVADARRLRERDEHVDAVYGRVAPRDGGGVWLQWWLFYFHSSKGIPGVRGAEGLLGAGLHQGDWELVQVGIPAGELAGPDPQPDVAIFAAHDYAHRIAWDEVDQEPGGGWAVYVGRDSHASFPKPGCWRGKRRGPFSFSFLEDLADGAGMRRRPPVCVIRTGDPAWVGWPGRWGATKDVKVLGSGSPRGPWRQPPWSDPDGFAERAHDWTEHHVSPQEVPEAAAGPAVPPAVTVGRSGADWTITIAMAAGTEADWSGVLTLLEATPRGLAARSYDVSAPGLAPSTGAEDG